MGQRQPPRTEPGGPNHTSVVLLLLLGVGLLVAGASGLGGGSEPTGDYAIESGLNGVYRFEILSEDGQRMFEAALSRENNTVEVSAENKPRNFPSIREYEDTGDESLYVERDGRIFGVYATSSAADVRTETPPTKSNGTETPQNRSNVTGASVTYEVVDLTDRVFYRYENLSPEQREVVDSALADPGGNVTGVSPSLFDKPGRDASGSGIGAVFIQATFYYLSVDGEYYTLTAFDTSAVDALYPDVSVVLSPVLVVIGLALIVAGAIKLARDGEE